MTEILPISKLISNGEVQGSQATLRMMPCPIFVLILNALYQGFQMRYHLFQKFFGKMVEIKETSFLSTRGMILIFGNYSYLEGYTYNSKKLISLFKYTHEIFLCFVLKCKDSTTDVTDIDYCQDNAIFHQQSIPSTKIFYGITCMPIAYLQKNKTNKVPWLVGNL